MRPRITSDHCLKDQYLLNVQMFMCESSFRLCVYVNVYMYYYLDDRGLLFFMNFLKMNPY